MKMSWAPRKRSAGPRTVANEAARRRNWQAILRRANFRCEGCGAIDHLELAHLCGRPGSGMCLGPWANSVELGVALCASDPMTGKIGCHPKIDRHLDNAKRDWLMSEAAHRMVARVMAEGMAGLLWGALGYTASDCIREEVRVLEAAGIEP